MTKTIASLTTFLFATVVVLAVVDTLASQGMNSVMHSNALMQVFSTPHVG